MVDGRERQADEKGRAATSFGINPQLAAMVKDGLSRKGKSKAKTIFLGGADERMKEIILDFRGDSGAGVLYPDNNRLIDGFC